MKYNLRLPALLKRGLALIVLLLSTAWIILKKNTNSDVCKSHDSLTMCYRMLIDLQKLMNVDNFNFSYSKIIPNNPSFTTKQLDKRLPQCLIIGARKAGTRALLEFLGLHSSVKAQKREVHFFDTDENYAKGFKWYKENMPLSRFGDITIEKTPAYFVKDQVPRRVHEMNSSISLLLIIRNPVYRTLSDYTQLKLAKIRKGLNYPPFETFAIDALTRKIRKNYKAIRRSIYYRHLKKWLKYFNLNQIHIVNGDNFVKNPLNEMQRVEQFLKLSKEFSDKSFYLNTSRNFYCMRLRNETNRCLHSSKGRSYENVSYSTMNKLIKFFRGHNKRFYELVGINFKWEETARRNMNKLKRH